MRAGAVAATGTAVMTGVKNKANTNNAATTTAVSPVRPPSSIPVADSMMKGTRNIEWERHDEAIPAFLTMVAMPLTYSIANGIALGIVSYVLLKLLAGKAREVHGLMYVLAALLVLYYGAVERV